MATDPRNTVQQDPAAEPLPGAPLAGSRKERLQRLQIGALGLATMILLVGLANIILTSAQQNRASSVPEEPVAVVTEDVPPPAPRDPLADAGVVPELSADPQSDPSADPSDGADADALPAQD